MKKDAIYEYIYRFHSDWIKYLTRNTDTRKKEE